MSRLHETIRAHLLDRDLPDDRRDLTQRHLQMMTPLIKFCSGEASLATPKSVPVQAAIAATASLLKIDAEKDPVAYGRLGLVCLPFSEMKTLPPNVADYATLYGRMLVMEFKRAPKELTMEDWQEMSDGLLAPLVGPFMEMFGADLASLEHFDLELRALIPLNYLSTLSLGTLYALNGYHEGMMRIAPMLRVMPRLMPVGFPVGQGMKLHALCRD